MSYLGGQATVDIDLLSSDTLCQEWTVGFERGQAIMSNRVSGSITGFTLEVEDADGRVTLTNDPQAESGGLTELVGRVARRFADAVRDGRPCQPDLTAGARVQHLVAAARCRAAHF